MNENDQKALKRYLSKPHCTRKIFNFSFCALELPISIFRYFFQKTVSFAVKHIKKESEVALILIPFSWIFNSQHGAFCLHKMKENTFSPIDALIEAPFFCDGRNMQFWREKTYANKNADVAQLKVVEINFSPSASKKLLILYWTLFVSACRPHLLANLLPLFHNSAIWSASCMHGAS